MKHNKRAFTVVELVIVIAIIAILAAVLIPTFVTLVNKANESNTLKLVRNLNTALKADKPDGVHDTMSDALKAAEGFGYSVDKINASGTDNEILWDSVNGCFVYLKDGTPTYAPELKDKKDVADSQLWRIVTKTEEATSDALKASKYSSYLACTVTGTLETDKGIDVGNNTGITAISYINDNEQTTAIRTNGGTLTIDAKNDTVYHFNTADKVEVLNVADHSYHENGEAKVLIVKKGHVALSKEAVVDMLVVEATASKITVDVAATVKSANVADGVEGKDQITAPAMEIRTVTTVAELNEAVNAATGNVFVQLANDIDAGNTSISVAPNGGDANITIDGNGHTITSTHNRMIQTCKNSGPYTGTLTITGVMMENSCTATSGNIRALSLWKFEGTLNLLDSKIVMPTQADNYGVNLAETDANVVMNIKNTEITAYQCVNIYGTNRTVNIDNCKFTSRNQHNVNYDGGCVAILENAIATVTINNTELNTIKTEGFGNEKGNRSVQLGSALGEEKGNVVYLNSCTANGKALTKDDFGISTNNTAQIAAYINGQKIDLNN